jgi:hypothetical protein
MIGQIATLTELAPLLSASIAETDDTLSKCAVCACVCVDTLYCVGCCPL